MKAILEFQLPEDQFEFLRASKASDLANVVWEMDQYLRKKMKYESEDMSEEVFQTYEAVRNHLSNLMDEHGLQFDSIIQ